MGSYRIGTVVAVYPATRMMALDLLGDINVGDKLMINNQEFSLKLIKIDYEQVQSAKRGNMVVVNMEIPVTIGDEVTTSS